MHPVRLFLRRHHLVRLYIVQSLIGFGISSVFVLGLLGLNVGGFATLALRPQNWPVIAMLWLFVGLTFASVQTGMAVMSMSGDGGGGGKRARIPADPAAAAVTIPSAER